MDGVCEIDRSGADGKVLDLAAGCEAVYVVREQVQVALEQVHKLTVIGHVLLPLKDLAEPGQFFFLSGLFNLLAASGFFIFPVGGNTVFGGAVHLIGADLDLKGLSGRTDERRVQGLIHVCLGHCDIVLEPAGDGLIHLMDRAEHGITVTDGADDDAYGKEVINLFKGFLLVEHFAIDTEEMFDSSVHFSFDAGFQKMLLDFYCDLLDIVFPLMLFLLNFGTEIIVDIGIKIFQREVIKFNLDLGNTKAVGDGRINIKSLLCDSLLLFGRHKLEGPHVVETVGKFDENDTDVLGHCKEHFAQVSGLHVLLGLGFVNIIA